MATERPEVAVTDIKIPFWSMVVLMVKWAFAGMPAVILGVAGAIMGHFFGPDWHWHFSSEESGTEDS
jgi:hypothetical protein